jgi:hypothetical protein
MWSQKRDWRQRHSASQASRALFRLKDEDATSVKSRGRGDTEEAFNSGLKGGEVSNPLVETIIGSGAAGARPS